MPYANKTYIKAEEHIKELKAKVREQEGVIAKLRADVSSLESKIDLMVDRKALEVELRMRKEVEAAYNKGFNSCKGQFLALKELQSTLSA